MSDPQQPRDQSLLKGCGTILMILIGFILLLPGLCTVLYGLMMVDHSPSGGNRTDFFGIVPLWLVGTLIGALGLGLILVATRR